MLQTPMCALAHTWSAIIQEARNQQHWVTMDNDKEALTKYVSTKSSQSYHSKNLSLWEGVYNHQGYYKKGPYASNESWLK